MQTEVPLTGFPALEHAVNKLDKKALRESAMAELKSGKKTARPQALKVLQVLEGLDRNELEPRDLMISKVPVIPPLYRPFAVVGDTFLPGDANELYRDLIQYKDFHNQLEKDLGEKGTRETKYNLYRAVRGVYGYDEPVNPKTKSRGVSGFLTQLLGSGSPKNSVFHRRLFSKTQDSISRAVVTAEPDLDLDEIGVPREALWKLYGPYVQRRLLRSGMSSMSALQNVADRSQHAMKALEAEMKERPVIYSRAPVWHKFGTLAGWPKLIDGDNIASNAFVSTGLGLDHDGDEVCNYVVFSVSEEKIPDLLKQGLTPIQDSRMLNGMFNNIEIPVVTESEAVFIADLEHFPRLELTNTKEGAKGRIDFFSVPDGTKVIALDETTGQPVWAEVAFYSKHYDREIETVTLACGKQLHTDDDPRAVYGMDPSSPNMELGRFTPTEAKNRGVVVPFVKDMTSALDALGTLDRIAIDDNTSLPLNWETGYLLGALAGDGWWDKKDYKATSYHRKIYIADLKGFNAAKVVDVMSSVFGKLSHYALESLAANDARRYGDSVKHTISFVGSTPFTKFLTTYLGGEGDENTTGSGNKHLPNFMLQASAEFRKGLLCGLVDTDGTVCLTYGHGKGKPSLTCNFCSTSHRLCRDVQLLAQTLGIQASISFSKTTTAGNASWITNLSSTDCKRLNVFSDLQSPWKRDHFKNGCVTEGTSLVFNKVVMPRVVVSELMKDVPSPKISKEERGEKTPALLRKKYIQNVWMSLNESLKSGTISRKMADRALELARELREEKLSLRTQVMQLLGGWDADTPFTQGHSDSIRKAFTSLYPIYVGGDLYASSRRLLASLSRPLKSGRFTVREAGRFLSFLENNPPAAYGGVKSDVVDVWERVYLANRNISWSPVIEVEKSGQPETGYDLTVPGYETFMSADGVILSNTMNVSLPSMPESVQEAKEKLMPSKMLLSIKSPDTIVPALKHEQILGLYTAKNSPAQNSHKFNTPEEALSALRSGQIRYSDEVELPD